MTKKNTPMTMDQSISTLLLRDDLPVEQLDKLLDLRERFLAKESESSFNRAMADFQKECPIIERKNKVAFKSTKYDYATLDEIVHQIKPILAKYGLSYSFDTKYAEKDFELITIINHIDGHSKSFSLTFPRIHDDARMNETQRMKSSLTYAKRAGLENALGIVTANEDDDARRAESMVISDKHTEEIIRLLERTKSDKDKLFSHFKISKIEELSEADAKKAISMLKAKL